MFGSPLRQLIVGAPRSGKTTTLIERAVALIENPERAPHMLALSTSQRTVQRLRIAFQDQRVGGVPTADVWRRAVSLLEQFPQSAGLAPNWKSTVIVSALDRRFLMQRAWAEVGGGTQTLYRQYGDAPGSLDWLVRVFDRFAEWSGSADPNLLMATPQDAGLAELWAAYRAYLAACQRFGLVAFQEVLPRALDVLRDERVAARVRPDVLILDDLDLFRSTELLFLRALVDPRTNVIATVSRAPVEDDPDPLVRMLHDWCSDFEVEPVETVLVGNKAPAPVLVAHANVDAEAAAIVREAAGAIRDGIAATDCAVVMFDQEIEAPLRRACVRYGIELVGMERRDAFTLAVAPVIVMGMRLIAADSCSPAELLGFMRHPLLDVPPADLRLLAVAVDGLAGPHMLHEGDPLPLLQRLWSAESSPAGMARFNELMEASEQARHADLDPSIKLRTWLHVLGIEARASAWTQQVLEPWAVEADAALFKRWFAFLEQSEQVHEQLGEPLGDRDAVDVLRSSQTLVEAIPRQIEDAVQVWSPYTLNGCSARMVWAAGLNERALPRPGDTLPWAAWSSYEAAFASLPGFAAADPNDLAVRWSEAQQVLRRVSGRADDAITLSWSATDRDGRRRLRSPLLQALPATASAVAVGVALTAERSMLVGDAPPVFPHPYVRTDAIFSTSPSAIENYLRCPRQYFYARELQLFDVVSSPRQAFGQVVHTALRDLEQGGEPTPDVVALLDAHWSMTEGKFGTRLRRAAFHEMAVDALRQVAQFDRERRSGGMHFVAAEARFVWRIAPDVELRGTIDRIDRGPQGLSVLDYKLGSTNHSINELLDMFVAPATSEERAAWRPSDLQLPLYALAIERGTLENFPELVNERVDEVGLVFPLRLYSASGKASSTGRRMIKISDHDDACTVCTTPRGRSGSTGEVCRSQLDAVVNDALAVVGAMQSGIIDPAPAEGADTCRICAFRTICPAPQA